MKYGRYMQQSAKPEWRLYYLDYDYLKNMLKESARDVKAGSVTKEEMERRFTTAIEREIKKINNFFLRMHDEIQGRITDFRTIMSRGMTDSRSATDALNSEIDQISQVLVDLAEYTHVNFTGFRKILKKHDKVTGMVASPWFMARCKQQPFWSSSKQFGNLLVRFSDCCSKARKILGGDSQAKEVAEGGFQAFERQTIKYWVKQEDVMRVKTTIAKHLPVYIFSSSSARFPRDPTDSAEISSCYYDNPSTMELYEGRLRKTEAAICVRFRKYQNAGEVFVERKTHHESWVTGGGSVKERFDLESADVFDFVRGSYKLEEYVKSLRDQDRGEEHVQASAKLFQEIQFEINRRNLVPTMTTAYNRTAFQIPGDASVRISLDTELRMIKEKLKLSNDGRWCKDVLQIADDDIHEFPYAVLEVKLQTHNGVEPPAWVTELTSGPLVKMAHKFSKYIHGCAMLLPELVPAWPAWIHEFENKEEPKEEEEVPAMSEEMLDIWGVKEMEQMEEVPDGVDENDYLVQLENRRAQRGRAAERSRAKEKSIIQQISDFFNFDKQMEKDGRPVMSRMKIEPKTYFANERTFLQWMSFSIIIQAIGIALISFPNSRFFGLMSGIFFVLCSLGVMGYALFQFRWRAARIRNNQPGRYDDLTGPVVLVVIMVSAVLVNMSFLLVDQIYNLSGDYGDATVAS